MPSALLAAAVPPEATATNNVPLEATAVQADAEGIVRAVHVMPSAELAALVKPLLNATKTLLPYAQQFHIPVLGIVDPLTVPAGVALYKTVFVETV